LSNKFIVFFLGAYARAVAKQKNAEETCDISTVLIMIFVKKKVSHVERLNSMLKNIIKHFH